MPLIFCIAVWFLVGNYAVLTGEATTGAIIFTFILDLCVGALIVFMIKSAMEGSKSTENTTADSTIRTLYSPTTQDSRDYSESRYSTSTTSGNSSSNRSNLYLTDYVEQFRNRAGADWNSNTVLVVDKMGQPTSTDRPHIQVYNNGGNVIVNAVNVFLGKSEIVYTESLRIPFVYEITDAIQRASWKIL